MRGNDVPDTEPRNVDMDTPICADPRGWVVCVECCVHCNAPSRWKMRSCLDTCAGVRTVHSLLVLDRLGVVSSSGWRSSDRFLSESKSVEKTMFARWRFRLVICTARTAA